MTSLASTPPWQLQWSEELSVGNVEIDADHQRFIQLVNELNDAISQRTDVFQLKQCMQAIVDDADAHFNREQGLFHALGYADAKSHEMHHAQTMNQLREILGGFNKHATEYEWIECGLRVKQILIEHLLAERTEYRR